jgi:hypothetical protein
LWCEWQAAKEFFGNAFSESRRAAGVNKSGHGLRQSARPTTARPVAQLNAIFGWTGSKMASHEMQAADRGRLAREAMSKLLNDARTSIRSPDQKVRAAGEKEQDYQYLGFSMVGGDGLEPPTSSV